MYARYHCIENVKTVTNSDFSGFFVYLRSRILFPNGEILQKLGRRRILF